MISRPRSTPSVDRSVPKRVVGVDVLGLEHLTAFVFLHVDGISTVEQIAYSTGLPHVEVIAMLEELCRRGVVRFEKPRGEPLCPS